MYVKSAASCRCARLLCLGLTLLAVGWLALGGRAQAAGPVTPPGVGAAGTAPAAVVTAPDFAWVQFNHRLLFPVFQSGDQSAQDRADLATLRLADLLRARTDGTDMGDAPQVSIQVSAAGTVLQIDKTNLLTVTEADADHANVVPGALAQTWAQKINGALREALRERRPAYRRWATRQALLIVLIGLGLHALLWLAGRGLRERFGWPLPALVWVVVAGADCGICFPKRALPCRFS